MPCNFHLLQRHQIAPSRSRQGGPLLHYSNFDRRIPNLGLKKGDQMKAKDGVVRRIRRDFGKIEKIIELESELLEKFQGKYKFDESIITITITRKDHLLVAQVPNQTGIVIFPVSETDFIMKDGPIRISFKMDDSGNVTGLVLNQSGKDSSAKKIE